MAEQTTVRREVSNFYAIIGGVVSAGSLISLAQKAFNVGLAPVLAELVAYYRQIVHFFTDWLLSWVPFHVPDWYHDLCVLSFVGIAVLGKAQFSVDQIGGTGRIGAARAVLFSAVLFAPTLGGILLLLTALHVREDQPVDRVYTTMVVAMIVATVAFFALNSQM